MFSSYQFALGGGYTAPRRGFDRPRQRLLMGSARPTGYNPTPTVASLASIVRGPNPFLINRNRNTGPPEYYGDPNRHNNENQGYLRTTRNQRKPVQVETVQGSKDGVLENLDRVKVHDIKTSSFDDDFEATGRDTDEDNTSLRPGASEDVDNEVWESSSDESTVLADQSVNNVKDDGVGGLGGINGVMPLMNLDVVLAEEEFKQLKKVEYPVELCVRIPEPVMVELACRFIVNLPKHEREDMNRVMFHTEAAFWFFVDQFAENSENTEFPECYEMNKMSHLQFAYNMFLHTPGLKHLFHAVPRLLHEYREYRKRIPTCGGILLTPKMQWVLLVRGFGGKWSFPKGKINENEDLFECAAREVFEETGFDVRPLASRQHFIDHMSRFGDCCRRDRLYIVPNVDYYTDFDPKTSYEIKEIAWFGVTDLPENRNDVSAKAVTQLGGSVNDFFLVFPYIRKLKIWIADKQQGKDSISSFEIPCLRQELNDMHESFMEPGIFRADFFGGSNSHRADNATGRECGKGAPDLVLIDAICSKTSVKGEETNKDDQRGPTDTVKEIEKEVLVIQTDEERHRQQKTDIHNEKEPHSERISDFYFYPPSWKNFSLDKDRIYQALRCDKSLKHQDDALN